MTAGRQARATGQENDMADQPRHPDISDDASAGAAGVPTAARPRWRLVLVIALVVAVLVLMIVLHVTGVVGANTNG
jgi:4-hydroxybenzoate polyprenyltransferase